MKKAMACVAALLVAVISTSCGKKEGTPEVPAYPVKIETVEGVRTVVNPALPKEGIFRYHLVEELVVGGEGGGAESVLNRPLYLDVDAYGNIFVMDWGDVDFKVFAPDGRLLRTFGKKGQGPGEFDVPASFDLTVDGRIVLLSGRQNQVIVLDGDGKYVSSFRVDGFCSDVRVDGRNRIYYTQMVRPELGGNEEYKLLQNRKVLFRSDELGRERTKLGEYLDVSMLIKTMKSGGGLASQSLTSRESYQTSWLVGPGDRVYLGYNKDYLLDVYDADWKLLFRFGREFTPIRHPAYEPNGAHPEFYPAFSDWRKFFDEKGDLWLEQYVEEGLEDHVYDVFSPEGIYLRQVRVPETLHLVRGDLGYSIIRQEDEFLVVKRFKLVPELAKDQQ